MNKIPRGGDANESDDADDGDEECLLDGYERCPLCNVVGCPGADDVCGHWRGHVWEGDLIWQRGGGDFEEAWRDAEAAAEDLSPEELARLRVAAPADTRAALAAVLSSDKFWWAQEGWFVHRRTGGMLSGSGYSIYHADPGLLDRAIESLAKVRALIVAIGGARD